MKSRYAPPTKPPRDEPVPYPDSATRSDDGVSPSWAWQIVGLTLLAWAAIGILFFLFFSL